MIKFTKDSLQMSVHEAECLTAFAGSDDTRPYVSVGVDDGYACATDGHTAVRFLRCDPGKLLPRDYNGSAWSRDYVVGQIKVAKALKTEVSLEWSTRLSEKFPMLSQVMLEIVKRKIACDGPVGVNATYLARLELVARACHGRGYKTKGVTLVGIADPLSPLFFSCQGSEQEAEVLIMLMGRV